MPRSLIGRRFIPLAAAAAMLVAGLGLTTTSAVAKAIPKDAAVSSSGAVITPAQGAATLASLAKSAGTTSASTTSASTTSTASAASKAMSSLGSSSFRGSAPQRALPKSIIGTDGRYRITPTTSYPARATVLITQNGALSCTGWMISKDTLLTAGHCVYSGGSGGTWYSGLAFKPGSDGGTAPYGTCSSRTTYALNGWINSADWNYDAAIVKLNCTVGNTVGWYGMYWQTATFNGTGDVTQGYPGDKPSTQWQAVDSIRGSETEKLYYQNDTVGGQSGSPVWYTRSSGGCVGQCGIAIHAYGVGGSGLAATNNSGTRITQAKFNTFVGIINTP